MTLDLEIHMNKFANINSGAPRQAAGGQFTLRWTESGGPTIAPPIHRGCGSRIMENIIGGQLGAKVRFDWGAPGLHL
jgi:hypothetical protein